MYPYVLSLPPAELDVIASELLGLKQDRGEGLLHKALYGKSIQDSAVIHTAIITVLDHELERFQERLIEKLREAGVRI